MMYDKSQLMRGTLEGCILSILSKEVAYGYEIVIKLQEFGFESVREGSIYPLLLRLEKKGFVSSEYHASPFGPARKYYCLSESGMELLEEFKKSWSEISSVVNQILEGGEE